MRKPVAAGGPKTIPNQWRFEAIGQNEVPRGRESRHKRIIDQLLTQIDQLAPGTALKVPLSALPTTKANLRAALNRATRKRGLSVATSSDAANLFLWKSKSRS
jgi:hypothetical protein